MELGISVYQLENTSILRVVGSVSEEEVYRFSRAIRDLVQKGANRVAIDISQIEYMESHALGIMVSHFLTLQRQGRELFLINSNNDPSFYMTRLLESTRLNEMIRIVNPSSQR
ncbi:MAG: STAS domain-containing protein [Chitinispirillaceae bacterium]|nr:STAS domain-containing protein [Chitinispirillaceae bacterium]